MLTNSLYIRLGLTVRGPYSLSDLHELASRGGFSKAHEVSTDKKDWTSASNHPELFPAARQQQSARHEAKQALAADTEDSRDGRQANRASSATEPGNAAESLQWISGTTNAAGTQSLRPLSVRATWTALVGAVGFVLLLVSTALIVLRLRTSPFVPGQNIGLIVMLCLNLVLGGVAIGLGHAAITLFQRQTGTPSERNIIVIGLSCGYTALILCLLFMVVLVISATG